MKLINVCNRLIEYSYYLLFLLVPLVFTSTTYELFEFNKMWLTFALTLIIGASWFTKMILQKRFFIQRTPLDIPITLFLLSQIISTIFSLDTHISIWGYYSRFNGGLLSIISYIFLYYAFVSNFSFLNKGVTRAGEPQNGAPRLLAQWENSGAGERQDPVAVVMVKRLLSISLISGFIVVLWGLPSHFGYDPTCLIFRGTFDVSCWTDAFQPKIRIFSTLGQPDWLAAYLAILLPLSITFFIKNLGLNFKPENKIQNSKFKIQNFPIKLSAISYLLLAILFYLSLLYTDARSGFVAIWIALTFFALIYFLNQKIKIVEIFKKRFLLSYWYTLVVSVVLICITFFVGTPLHQLDNFTFNGIKNYFQTKQKVNPPANSPAGNKKPAETITPPGGIGGTPSEKIRLIVWEGALNIWKNNPLFGTGVETFAFSYYKYRPAAHNLTSEWDYLYNKAHNEYLNYLATTGIFGLGTYLMMIGWFLFIVFKNLKSQKSKIKTAIQNSKPEKYQFSTLSFGFDPCPLDRASRDTLILALVAGYISILVSNFFGFSVVIVNLYLFLIPAFVLILQGMVNPQKVFTFPKNESGIPASQRGEKNHELRISNLQKTGIIGLLFAFCFLLFNLLKFWQADTAYALGYNLDKMAQYQQAYQKLHEAATIRGDEPVFQDELALNDAILAVGLSRQNETKSTSDALIQEAIKISNDLIAQHPNNVSFWKSRVRLFYLLNQADPKYLPVALEGIKKASQLAPTDAKISYNMGLLYGQANDNKNAIDTLENTVKLKPDYKDAYYALGLFYRDAAMEKDGRVKDPVMQRKAVETMKYILNNITPDNAITDLLKSWGEY